MKTALGQESSHALDPASLVERLVQALSSDSSWVELYIITGELVIPRVVSDDKESQEAISRAIEVSPHYSVAILSIPISREDT